MDLNEISKEASNKIKNSFLSLVNCSLHEDGLTPLSAKHIYKSIGLPKSLYGYEVWSNLSPTQVLSMERAQRFCAKSNQSLSRNANTDVTSMEGFHRG